MRVIMRIGSRFSSEVMKRILTSLEIHSHEECAAALKRHEDELKRLKKEGFGVIPISARFDRVGMSNEYNSVYRFESDGSHNSLQASISRHVELDQNDFELALYKERSLDDYRSRLDSAAALLADATEKIHERLKSGRQKEVRSLSEELASIRATHGGLMFGPSPLIIGAARSRWSISECVRSDHAPHEGRK